LTGNTIVNASLGVGITPSVRLHVNGNALVAGQFSAGATTLSSSNTTGNATIGGTLGVTGAKTVSSVSTSGVVGIQTADTSNDLTINGALDTNLSGVILRGSTTSKQFAVGQSAGRNVMLGWNYNATPASAVGYVECYAGSNPLLLQRSGGFVGIGANTPLSTLDVNGGILARGANSISFQGAHIQWNRSSADGETWLINQRGGGNSNAGIRFGSSTVANAVTEWMRIIQNGYVGIGTQGTPLGRLHLAADGSTNNQIVIEAGTFSDGSSPGVSAINFNGYSTASNLRINTSKNRWRMVCAQNATNDYLAFDTFNGTTNTEIIRMNANGSITYPTTTTLGVNTSVGPFGKLHLASGSNANNVVIEAGTTSDGNNSGFSAINFNGYFSGSEQRINTGKYRWRVAVNQRDTSDNFFIDAFHPTTIGSSPVTVFTILSNLSCRTWRPVIQNFLRQDVTGSGTTTLSIDTILRGLVHINSSGVTYRPPAYSVFSGLGFVVGDTFPFMIYNNSGGSITFTHNAGSLFGLSGTGNIVSGGFRMFMIRLHETLGVDIYPIA
jgi:hypothetical protein